MHTFQQLRESGYRGRSGHNYDRIFKGDRPPLGAEFEYFPEVHAVVFDSVPGGVPWNVLMRFLQHPGLTSLTFEQDATWMCVPPPRPFDLTPAGCCLTTFSYTPSIWRGLESNAREENIRHALDVEASYLLAIVPRLSNTAEPLALPVQTAPLQEMAATDWPRLRTFSLTGQYGKSTKYGSIPSLLARMPNIRSLSVQVAPSRGCSRPCIADSTFAGGSRIESLTISYPNPADPIFSSLTERLTSLSLCDSLRFYFYNRYSMDKVTNLVAPILGASECLTILKRVSAPRLVRLELVYCTDDAEDDLLRYLALAFPILQELELHRYRPSQHDEVPYLHLATMLTAIPYLRGIYLNLDVYDPANPAPWDLPWPPDQQEVERLDSLGKEILWVLENGRCFEFVALHVHQNRQGKWSIFQAHDSEDMPFRFGNEYMIDCIARGYWMTIF
ncbi:hypothetical protein C2E23DRAFT_785610 [Lenzites betulinus]|nr:hypothetical protein C2E23DRAFT_785610 [Lenzites betulinus]